MQASISRQKPWARGRCYLLKTRTGCTLKTRKKITGRLIPKISARDLIEMDLGDLIIERVVLKYLQRSTHVEELHIINGMVPGNITKALNGEHVGTIIHK